MPTRLRIFLPKKKVRDQSAQLCAGERRRKYVDFFTYSDSYRPQLQISPKQILNSSSGFGSRVTLVKKSSKISCQSVQVITMEKIWIKKRNSDIV